ncbi:hypothetical protein [Brucella pseudogrignonensis]|uniref:Uncharacterized protein n=1 Tax=Brucella pseudogrignonensis TaxID=419475 RepID=A0A256GFH0_9HYPH|nr:hypothetical protein [Brucella pseudogrignonensis]OYR25863.1 hypothetical protein CEV34_2649 [Brucella pseudogrignonensis]
MNAQTQTETGTDIVGYVSANPVSVLVDEKIYSQFYEQIKAETDAFKPDLSTVSSRKEISSLAYKVTRTKTAIDAAGKKLNEDARAKINAVDAQRRKIREELDTLAETVRKPLTEWEAAEEARIENIKSTLAHIDACGKGMIGGEPQAFAILFRELEEKIIIDDSFGEFKEQAEAAKSEALAKLKIAFDAHQKAEADRIELEKLRAEKEERDRLEAKRAEKERIAQEALAREKAEKEHQERLAAEQKAREERAAQQAREQAEREAREAIERAEREKADAVAKAEAEALAVKQKAEQAEAKRAAEAKRIADEQAARDADTAHRSKIMKSAKEALMAQGADEETAKKIVLAVIAGEIPNVTLRF